MWITDISARRKSSSIKWFLQITHRQLAVDGVVMTRRQAVDAALTNRAAIDTSSRPAADRC